MKSHSTNDASVCVEAAERVSALMDGEIAPPQFDLVLKELQQEEVRNTWSLYHLIGDTLRAPDLARSSAQTRERILAALDAEPPMIVRQKLPGSHAFRRHLLPAGAVAAAIGMVGWMVWPQWVANGGASPAQLAGIEAPASLHKVASPVAPRLHPQTVNGLNEYLMAHQQFSPSVASYGMAPMARGGAPAMVIEVSANK